MAASTNPTQPRRMMSRRFACNSRTLCSLSGKLLAARECGPAGRITEAITPGRRAAAWAGAVLVAVQRCLDLQAVGGSDVQHAHLAHRHPARREAIGDELDRAEQVGRQVEGVFALAVLQLDRLAEQRLAVLDEIDEHRLD